MSMCSHLPFKGEEFILNLLPKFLAEMVLKLFGIRHVGSCYSLEYEVLLSSHRSLSTPEGALLIRAIFVLREIKIEASLNTCDPILSLLVLQKGCKAFYYWQ